VVPAARCEVSDVRLGASARRGHFPLRPPDRGRLPLHPYQAWHSWTRKIAQTGWRAAGEAGFLALTDVGPGVTAVSGSAERALTEVSAGGVEV
jgi:hypothetical protein